MKTIKELDDEAMKLYETRAEVNMWIDSFEPVELAKLWNHKCMLSDYNVNSAPYDDEVYDALNRLNYFK